MADHLFLEGFRIHGLGQMVGNIGNPVTDRFDAFGNDLIAIHRSGGNHLLNIRVKKQRTMVYDAVGQPVLRIAGKFPSVNGQVIASVKGRLHPHLPQCIKDGSDVLTKLDGLFGSMLDKGKLPAAEICIDGAAAGHAPHQTDTMAVGVGLVDLLQHILVFSHHQRGGGAPEQEHRVRQTLFHGEIVLQRKVIVHIGRPGLNIDHAHPPALPKPGRSCGPAGRTPHGGSPC